MNLLIVDTGVLGLSFAWRAVQAGHKVKWFIKPKKENNPETGDGFKGIEKVENWVAHAMWADLIVPTGNDDYLPKLDMLRKRGKAVFGPTEASAKLEISRKAGMELMEKHGFTLAPYQTFPSIKEATEQVKKDGKRYVFKTMGDNEDKSLTYCSKNAADMLEWMKRLKKQPKGEVMLQEFVEDAIEMGVSRFMGKTGFVGPWNESFEYKKLMSGNFGCNTGEMGTVAYFTDKSKLGEETLGKLEKELVKIGHMGDVAIGFMVTKKGPIPTEFTIRCGWPIFNMMLGAMQGDPVQWMFDAATTGKDTSSFKQDIGICYVMCDKALLYPPGQPPDSVGIPIYGVTKGTKPHLHPQGVKIDVLFDQDNDKMPVERPVWNTTNEYIVVVTGFGKDVEQAITRGFGTVKKLQISDACVRDDIGKDLEQKLPELHKLGYATHCEYAK